MQKLEILPVLTLGPIGSDPWIPDALYIEQVRQSGKDSTYIGQDHCHEYDCGHREHIETEKLIYNQT